MQLLTEVSGRIFERTYLGKPTSQTYYSHSYIVNIPLITKIRNAITHNRVIAIPENSKVFFSKSVEFSRSKFRYWGSLHNIQITRKIENADFVVLDFTIFNNLIKDLKIRDIFFACTGSKGWGYYEDHTEDGFSFDTKSKQTIHNPKQKYLEIYEQYEDYIDIKAKFIKTEDLSELILTETMEEENYNSIHDMFNTEEPESIELAIEFISNYSWTTSALYITKLFYHHYSKIAASKNISCVTFAHLKPLFEESAPYTRNNYMSEFKSVWNFLSLKGRESLVTEDMLREEIKKSLGTGSILPANLAHNLDVTIKQIEVEVTTNTTKQIIKLTP